MNQKTETKTKVNWIILVVGILALIVVGCNSYLDRLTPAEAPKFTLEYLGGDPAPPWYSLHDAREDRTDTIRLHRDEQKNLLRLAEDDELAFQDAIGFINTSIEDAESFQKLLVGSAEQPISILGMLAGLGIGFPVGKMLKRRGDYSPEEHEAEVKVAKASVVNGNL